MQNQNDHYPMLKSLCFAINYLEQFLAVISEPLLIACAVLAVIDFITGGGLLASSIITYAFATTLAIAVSSVFIVTWRRAFSACVQGRLGIGITLALLGLTLGIVDWAAIDVQSFEQALHIPFISALSELNLNIIVLTHLRSAVVIAMTVVVALSNHTMVTAAQRPPASKRRIILFDRVLNTIAPVVHDEQIQVTPAHIEQPPDHREQPVTRTFQWPSYDLSTQSQSEQGESVHADHTQVQVKTEDIETDEYKQTMIPAKLHMVKKDSESEKIQRVTKALSMEPACSNRRLAELTHLAQATAKKYRLQIEQEIEHKRGVGLRDDA
jgi:hypothetical protein